MKHRICTVLLLIAFSLPASARLGETEQELIARFGEAASRTKDMMYAQGKTLDLGAALRFRQSDWTVTCVVIDGRSAQETYQKTGDWTEDQITTVLNSNAQRARWNETSNNSMRKLIREWRRNDGATATWKLGTMIVTHPAYQRAKATAEAKAKAQASRPPKI